MFEGTNLYGTSGDGSTLKRELLQVVEVATYYTLEAKFYPGEKIDFYVNGDLKGTITTNLPAGALYANTVMNMGLFNNEATENHVYVGYFEYWQEA